MGKSQRYKFFSLIELLIVIAIIAILAAMLLPVLNKAQNRAVDMQCKNRLKNWGNAFYLYANDYEDYLMLDRRRTGNWGWRTGFAVVLRNGKYLPNSTELLERCPDTKNANSFFVNSTRYNSLASYGVSGRILLAISSANMYTIKMSKLNPGGYILVDVYYDTVGNAGSNGDYEDWRHQNRANAVFADSHVANVTELKGTTKVGDERDSVK